MPTPPHTPVLNPTASTPDWLGVVTAKVGTLRFGVIQITVHEGRVTQVDVAEKTRFPCPPGPRTIDPD